MRHAIRLPGENGPDVVIEHHLFRIPEVFVDGRPVERLKDRGRPYWPIPTAGGRDRRLFLRSSLTGLRAAVDGTIIPLERRLALWELVLALLPFGLVSFGAVGGIVGLVAWTVNLRIIRRQWPAAVRAAAVLGVLVAATFLTLVLLRLTGGS